MHTGRRRLPGRQPPESLRQPGRRTSGLDVVLLNRQRRRRVSLARLRGVLEGAALALGVSGEVALVLAGDRAVRTLNARYRGKDKPTDVLSFPGPGGEIGLGDIVISLDRAAANARRFARTLPQELDILALHGFLPGDLQEKVDPYLRPLYDALYDLLDYEKVSRLLERNQIEVAPIAFMRGRTLNDAFVIIDEAQNTTTEQMKMVLTRIGFGSKVVVTGDITQIDLPAGRTSGLVEAISVLGKVNGISFVYFDEKDVVRHRLVQAVIRAYDAYGTAQAAR